jgi:hypothetical protein
MSKKTSNTAAALMYAGKKRTVSKNTQVEDGNLYLFGNRIAIDSGENTIISHRGWLTPTTKDRLNALTNVSICQKRGSWFLNGREWNGDWVLVNKLTGEWVPEDK